MICYIRLDRIMDINLFNTEYPKHLPFGLINRIMVIHGHFGYSFIFCDIINKIIYYEYPTTMTFIIEERMQRKSIFTPFVSHSLLQYVNDTFLYNKICQKS